MCHCQNLIWILLAGLCLYKVKGDGDILLSAVTASLDQLVAADKGLGEGKQNWVDYDRYSTYLIFVIILQEFYFYILYW